MSRKIYLYVRLAVLSLLAGYVVHLGIQNYRETSKLNDCALLVQSKLSEAGAQYNPVVLQCKNLVLKGDLNRVVCSFEDDVSPGGPERRVHPVIVPAGFCD